MAGRSKRSSQRDRARRLRWATLAAVLLVALVWVIFGPRLRALLGLAGEPIADRGAGLRVVSWNLENFGAPEQIDDLERLRATLLELDADVIALQELVRPELLAELLPEYELVWSEGGGLGQQRVGIAWRPERVELLAGPFEHDELALGGRVRPGFSAYLRGRGGVRDSASGPDFWLIVVHLKAMPEGIEMRRRQWPQLVELAQRAEVGELGFIDEDLVIVGDFNSTGPPMGSWADEQRELAAALEPAELRRIPCADGCTAYYDGRRRDAWKEPSEIDLVWVRGLAESLDADARVRAGTHCGNHRCEPFRSTEAYPEPTFEQISDHCPVVLDLTRADDDADQ